MLNQPPEYFLSLHNAELASYLETAERRRNVERRRAGNPDPLQARHSLFPRPDFRIRLDSFSRPGFMRIPGRFRRPAWARRLRAAALAGPAQPLPCESCP